jgi:hypothetical protein
MKIEYRSIDKTAVGQWPQQMDKDSQGQLKYIQKNDENIYLQNRSPKKLSDILRNCCAIEIQIQADRKAIFTDGPAYLTLFTHQVV